MQMSSLIHKKTMLGTGSWIYTTPEIGRLLAKYCFVPYPEDSYGAKSPIFKLGTIAGAWTVYVDNLATQNTSLMGYKGRPFNGDYNWNIKSGYQYCPQIPLIPTPEPPKSFPDGFLAHPALMTKYAKKLVRGGGNYYGLIKCKFPIE